MSDADLRTSAYERVLSGLRYAKQDNFSQAIQHYRLACTDLLNIKAKTSADSDNIAYNYSMIVRFCCASNDNASAHMYAVKLRAYTSTLVEASVTLFQSVIRADFYTGLSDYVNNRPKHGQKYFESVIKLTNALSKVHPLHENDKKRLENANIILGWLTSARQGCASAAPNITDQGETQWKNSPTKSPPSSQSLQLRS